MTDYDIMELMIASEFHRMGKKADKAPIALLIHGMAGSYRIWDRTVIFLMRQGYNVITLDLSGHGASKKRNIYSFDTWVEDVLEVLKKHNIEQLDLILGHSLGGLITTGVSKQIPTKKIVFIDPLLVVPIGIMRPIIKRILRMGSSTSLKQLIERHPNRDPQQLLNEYESIQKWDVNCLEALKAPDGIKLITGFLTQDELPKTLLLRPHNSVMIPNGKVKFFEEHNISVVSIRDVGHGLHHDDHEQFETIVEAFITS